MKVGGLGEFGLLERIKPYRSAQAGQDDVAVIAEAGGFTVASCDMAVEGVHFDLGWMTAEDAGWRALALALGDLAAKGATPAWALISVEGPAVLSITVVGRTVSKPLARSQAKPGWAVAVTGPLGAAALALKAH